jgi:hypothetical protein
VSDTDAAAARRFLIKWCIFMAIFGVALGFVLPFLKDSPPYP